MIGSFLYFQQFGAINLWMVIFYSPYYVMAINFNVSFLGICLLNVLGRLAVKWFLIFQFTCWMPLHSYLIVWWNLTSWVPLYIIYKYLLSLNTSFFSQNLMLEKRRSKYRNYLYTMQLTVYLNHCSFHMMHIGLFCRVYFVFMFFFFLLKKVVVKWMDGWFTAVG